MTIGEKIKSSRLSKGLTQKQLGQLCGMADSAIRRYELGGANPKIETLQKIANALNIDISYFRDEIDITRQIYDYNHKLGALNAQLDMEGSNPHIKSEIFSTVQELEELQRLLINISKPKYELMEAFENLNSHGQEKLVCYAKDLAKIPEYKKE